MFRGSILVSKLLKQGYSSQNVRLFLRNYTVVIQTCAPISHFCATLLYWRVCSSTVTYDWLPVILWESWRVPHVGKKCSLIPEHLMPLHLGSSWFHPFIVHTLQNLSDLGLCLRIMVSLTYFIRAYTICFPLGLIGIDACLSTWLSSELVAIRLYWTYWCKQHNMYWSKHITYH